LFVLRLRIASYRPRIRRERAELWVTTALWLQVLLLGSYRREVHVDGASRFVFVDERRFWLWKRRAVVPFRQVAHIAYGFSELPTAGDIHGGIHDSLERFDVHLARTDAEPAILVARFRGAGAMGDPGTWLLGDDLIDIEGTQERDSRDLVEHLVDILGVGVEPSRQAGSTLA